MKFKLLMSALSLCLMVLGCKLNLFPPKTNPFYVSVLKEYPKHQTALQLQGDRLLSQGQYGQAQGYFLQLVEINKKNDKVWLGLGQCQMELMEFSKAADSFAQARSIKSSMEAHMGYAMAVLLDGQINMAKKEVDELRSAYGESPALKRLEGDIKFVDGDPSGALAAYQESLKDQPSQPDLAERVKDLQDYLTSGQ